MNKLIRVSLLTIANIFIQHTCYAFFSLKEVTSWALGYEQETMHKEFPCEDTCLFSLENHTGSIYIKTWSLPKIVVQGIKQVRQKEMSLINMQTTEEKHTIAIQTIFDEKKVKGAVDYYCIIPPHVNVKVFTQSGSIKIKNIQGTVEAKTQSGSIDVHEVQNGLTLTNAYGSITVTIKELQPAAHLILDAYGAIAVHVPSTCNADIHAKTQSGTVTSDVYVTLKPVTTKLNNNTWNNLKKEINATIGKGGSSIHLVSVNGNIKILEY